ncbi:MAG: DUF2339 domain-containing protein [Burkholderiales bacterium]
MWFLGLILGAILGGAIEGDEGAAVGAIAGAILGWQWRHRSTGTAAPGRVEALEDRVRDLAATVDLLRSRIRLLEEQAPRGKDADIVTATPPSLAPTPGPDEAVVPSAPTPAAAGAGPATMTTASSPVPTGAEPPPIGTSPPVGAEGVPPTVAPEPLSTSWGGGPAMPAWIARALAWFSGGNAVVRVGLVVLFFGVAFLLKYAYDHAFVPPAWRVAGAMLGGTALLALGWRLRQSKPAFALPLQGGGVGIMYLAVFAAFRLYDLLPAGAAFSLLALLAIGTVILALVQNVQMLALLAVSGGFLAPVLASTGSGNHVALFTYYGILDGGILAIAARRAWRPLNLTGFVFTFAIGALWGADAYRPELFASTQPFLALFFLIYLAIPALFARQAGNRTDGYLDGTLVFGLPIVAFALQSRVVAQFEYGLALSALAASACYVAAARVVKSRHHDTHPLLIAAFASIAFVLATLAIPLALDARWSSAAWALEGAAVAWVGLRQKRWLPRVAGYGLQLGAAALFLHGLGFTAPALPVLNRDALGFVFLALAAWFTAHSLERHADAALPAERGVRFAALGAGGLWWVAGVLRETDRFVPEAAAPATLAAVFALTCVAFDLLRRRLSWADARHLAWALPPLLALALMIAFAVGRHPFGQGGLIAWPTAVAAWLWILRRHDHDGIAPPVVLPAIALWVVAGTLAAEGRWLGTEWFARGSAWPVAGMLAAIAITLGAVVRAARTDRWPVVPHTAGLLDLGAGLLASALLAFTLAHNVLSDGAAPPLPYVPGLNPLDLASVGALLSIEFWMRAVRSRPIGTRLDESPWTRHAPIGIVAFLVANAALLRTLHHHVGAPLDPLGVMHSRVDQAGLSIFWTAMALVLMMLAHRRSARGLWLTGAALLGVTVLKLFVVDLANAGSVERIVSFVVVGLLMLVVGYFAPAPPKPQETET